jgi:hypothetical protein
MMTRLAPASAATAHSEAAGSTVSVLPMARNRSQYVAAAAARSNTPGSSAWPYHRGGLEDPAAPGARRIVVADADPAEGGGHIGSLPQQVQITADIVPCSSMTCSCGVLARWCRPSMIWVMTWVSMALLASRARARCAGFGSAAHAGWASLYCQDQRRSRRPASGARREAAGRRTHHRDEPA